MVGRISSVGGRPTIGILQFPGSNCDVDFARTLQDHLGLQVTMIWHQQKELPAVDAIVLPGGFSYGDYVRSGVLAAISPVMDAVRGFVQRGGYVLGVCNGFQILTEAKLLPGALLGNASQKFICQYVHLKNENGWLPGILSMPVAHGEGRYYADPEKLRVLEGEGLVALRYCNSAGEVREDSNPNGAVQNIAGIFAPGRRVLGLMPHPERAVAKHIGGSDDGIKFCRQFFSPFL